MATRFLGVYSNEMSRASLCPSDCPFPRQGCSPTTRAQQWPALLPLRLAAGDGHTPLKDRVSASSRSAVDRREFAEVERVQWP